MLVIGVGSHHKSVSREMTHAARMPAVAMRCAHDTQRRELSRPWTTISRRLHRKSCAPLFAFYFILAVVQCGFLLLALACLPMSQNCLWEGKELVVATGFAHYHVLLAELLKEPLRLDLQDGRRSASVIKALSTDVAHSSSALSPHCLTISVQDCRQ